MPVPPEGLLGLPRPPGWKYESWDGRLRLEPDWRYEVARWVGPLPSGEAPRGVTLEPIASSDLEEITRVADAAFVDGPDFFGHPAGRRRQSLARDVEDALRLEPEWVRRADRCARTPEGRAVGLLMVREVAGGVTLSTVGVRPAWRRRGLAAAMLREALAVLPGGVEVRSSWLVANRESAAWHRRAGFEILPTSVSVASRLGALRWAQASGEAARRAVMEAVAEVERLQEAERAGQAPDPFAFAQPIHRRPPREGQRSRLAATA